MPLKSYRPYTPTRRFMTIEDFSDITKPYPEKKLTVPIHKHSGRNNTGKIMVRHQGGGTKQRYRIIDFKRDKSNVPGKIVSIEYDPNRSARIALVEYPDKDKRYILMPLGLKLGDEVMSGPEADIKPGNALPLHKIPEGTLIHNLELNTGKGGVLVRSAGGSAQILAKESQYAQVKMPSGEIRLFPIDCYATIGQVGNIDHENITWGKAGRKRNLGIRPTVRGTAMNSVDHPHGGGRGRSKGNNQPQSPWGQPAKGYRTRGKKKSYAWMIVRHRTSTITTA